MALCEFGFKFLYEAVFEMGILSWGYKVQAEKFFI